MNSNSILLIRLLKSPRCCREFSPTDWDLAIRQARSANLIASLHYHLDSHALLDGVLAEVKLHLESARITALALARSVRWEVHCLVQALKEVGVPVILLKGAAYTLADLPVGRGRMFSDIDIIVPKSRLDEVERDLIRSGWITTHWDVYDQRYYRRWMHELPPMRHIKRKSSLDVHHTILPETADLHPDPSQLIANAQDTDSSGKVKIFAPIDMVLHSATHLFHDGELEHGTRDLFDLHQMLTDFADDPEFWDKLLERAEQQDLIRPLYYALRYTGQMFETKIPDEIQSKIQTGRPAVPLGVLMDWLFLRALMPDHPSCKMPFSGFARWLLYIRSHYLRMPLYLLIPHLIRKSIRGEGDH